MEHSKIMKGRENHPSANQYTKEPNIIDLLCLLDDFMIVNVLLEMEPLQMMIFGAVSKFYKLASTFKIYFAAIFNVYNISIYYIIIIYLFI